MTTDWLLRVGDGENFKNSSLRRIWGINTREKSSFIKDVKCGDRLWFIINKSKGQIIAVATYCSHNKRNLGPIVEVSLNNKELGWSGDDVWDVEVHYTDLYGLIQCDLVTKIKGQTAVRRYYDKKCNVNLPVEYNNILRYSKLTFEL
jgi:hypothetical protein